MLARLALELPLGDYVHEPTWDGWRVEELRPFKPLSEHSPRIGVRLRCGATADLCRKCDEASTAGSPADGGSYRRLMPRKPRAFVDGIYHLGSHGSDDRDLFVADDERSIFLDGLSRIFEGFELGVVAYTLMGNHYHTLLRIPDARVSRALQQLHTWYSRLHNRLNARTGHLFRAHPFAREIESDEDLLGVARYLAWNPVEAGLAADPLEWSWGSAAATAGLELPRIPLHLEPIQHALGGGRAWRKRYAEHVAGPTLPRAA
jgi:REP element-mobilizing transposase RayT